MIKTEIKRALFALYNLVRLHPALRPVAESRLFKKLRRSLIAEPLELASAPRVTHSAPPRLDWDVAISDDSPVAVLAIYRQQNAHLLARLLSRAGMPLKLSLWALDQTIPGLERYTVGVGPGTKFTILNALMDTLHDHMGFFVVADDDVTIERGSLAELIRIQRLCGFDLCQPAHVLGSDSSYRTTLRRVSSVARRTNFVEIGPLFVLGPKGRKCLTPFPDRVGMGWGLEYEWLEAAERGVSLGVVDAVRMRHHARPGATYDDQSESSRVQDLAARRDGASLHELQSTLEVWRRGRPSPPWLDE